MKFIAIVTVFCLGFSTHYASFSFEEVSRDYLPLSELRFNSMDVETADLDKDGDLDIVVAMEFRPNVLLLNDGSGKMIYSSPGRLPKKNHDSEDIALGDFDSDGDLDIIFVSEDDRIHEYYLNDGRASFSDASDRFAFNSTCNSIEAADFDKDGDLDLVMGNDGQDFFLLNNGKGEFIDDTKNRMPEDASTTQDVQSADLDMDGDLDLVLGNEDGNCLYLNDGNGNFTDATKGRLPLVNEETRKVDISDIDMDGDQDLVFSNVDFRKGKAIANRILINQGTAVFADETPERYLAPNQMHTGDVILTDLDGDKDPDMIVSNLFGGYMQVLINNGKGVFTDASSKYFSGAVAGEGISVEVADWNRDSLPDVYFGMFRNEDRMFLGKKRE